MMGGEGLTQATKIAILKKKAEELRIPHTIMARTLIVQGLKAGPPTGGSKESS
jgi:hypothetical protein